MRRGRECVLVRIFLVPRVVHNIFPVASPLENRPGSFADPYKKLRNVAPRPRPTHCSVCPSCVYKPAVLYCCHGSMIRNRCWVTCIAALGALAAACRDVTDDKIHAWVDGLVYELKKRMGVPPYGPNIDMLVSSIELVL